MLLLKNTELLKGATDLLKNALVKKPVTTFIVAEEVNIGSWGIGGETVTERRKKGV